MAIYGIIWVLIPESALGSLPKSLRLKIWLLSSSV